MFNKIINLTVTKDDYEVLDNEIVKTASEVVLPDGYEFDPDFLYIKVRAISAGEYYSCNKNGDFFPEEELKANYKTFLDAHVFKNHENKEVEKAIGDVMDAVWNDEMKYVELFIRINRKVAPTIVTGFEKGFMTDVSMGCRVDHTICSICGNIAKTPSQYCQHIRHHKHEILEDGRKVMEINIKPKFHDISAVLNGADRTAKMTAMYVSNEKKAQLEKEWGMNKVASESTDFHERFSNSLSQKPTPEELAMEKVASTYCIQEFDTPLFEKRASNISTMEKIAEIKKKIKGNVIGIARNMKQLKDNECCCEQIEGDLGSKAVMSLEQMDSLGRKICEIADEERISPIKILNTFFKLSAISGRIFSPSETVGLMKRVSNCRDTSTALATPCFSDGDDRPLVEKIFSQVGTCSQNSLGLNGITEILGKIFGGIHPNPGFSVPDPQSMPKGRIIIMRMSSPTTRTVSEAPISQPTIIKRVIKLANELNNEDFEKLANTKENEVAQVYDYDFYTNSPLTVGAAIEKIAYSTYLDEMKKYVDSQDYNFDKSYYCNDLEKVAITKPAIFSAITPAVVGYGYSRYQGTKAREGRPMSTMERFTAENPEAVAAAAAIAGYNTEKFSRNIARYMKGTPQTRRRMRYRVASDESLIDEILNMEKLASIDSQSSFEQNLDIFDNKDIDDCLVKEGYSKEQAKNLKLASVLYAYERQDVCDNVLNNSNLDYNDIENFLKVAVEYVADKY